MYIFDIVFVLMSDDIIVNKLKRIELIYIISTMKPAAQLIPILWRIFELYKHTILLGIKI